MQVVIAEKPSVAKNIADALNIKKRQDGYFEGDKYLITWAFGHLLELYDAKDYDEKMAKWEMDNFPFIPEVFKYKVKSSSKNKNKADSGAKKQLNTIKKLINRKDVDSVISACDYDREGQIIADIIFNYLEIKKPIYRMLLNEWTPDEVKRGLKNLKLNSELKPISDAGISRQWADWVIGINLTSVATLRYKSKRKSPKEQSKVLNIGRVIMPTLKIVYDRDKEIENFKSKDYYKLNGRFITNNDEVYEGVYYENKNDKFDNKKDLEKIVEKAKGNKAIVSRIDTVKKKEYAPYLFNLSSLQGHITSKYSGWTSDKVLKVAQSLYEKKYITYPRTASIALEESLVGRAERVLNTLKKGLPYENEIKFTKSKRVFNNKKVEGHSAIIPTYIIPSGLTKDESILYEEIKDRFIMQFMPASEYEETTVETSIDNKDIDGIFITKGKVVVEEGWKKVQKNVSKDVILPKLSENQLVSIDKLSITAHKTKPPAHHTEKTLLRVMETAGKGYNEVSQNDDEKIMESVLSGFSIGTPATRADTIKKLKTAGYIKAKGKSLICTELGKSLVEVFPVKELLDLEYTGRLEKTLTDIEKGKVSKEEFLNFIFKFTEESVEKIKNDKKGVLHMDKNYEHDDIEVLGICPECGQQIIENSKAYGCSGWKEGCNFAIWKNDRYLASMKKKPTKKMVRELLATGKTYVSGLVSKKGNKFDAILRYEKNPDTGYYNWHMEFPERE